MKATDGKHINSFAFAQLKNVTKVRIIEYLLRFLENKEMKIVFNICKFTN